MSRVRPSKKGSFGGHLEELVKHFPHDDSHHRNSSPKDTAREAVDQARLKEKLDIHAQLFAMAWGLEPDEADWLKVTEKL